ncbi:MAG: glycosyltransferase [Parvibaculum sp.]
MSILQESQKAVGHILQKSGAAERGRTPHVILVLPTYLPESYGGAEQQSRKLAQALVARGMNVTLLAPRIAPETPTTERKDGVLIRRFRLTSLPNLGGRHFASFAWWSLRIAFWLWRNRQTYDVIHIIHGRLHAVGPVIGGRLADKPTLIKFGRGGEQFDIDTVKNKRLFGPQFAAIIRRWTTGFIANSAQMLVDLDRHGIGEERVHRIANGVVMPEIEERNAHVDTSETRFVYMGRLDREKALDLMIRGFAGLPSTAAARLVLVGEGPKQRELKALATDLGVASRVDFTGRLDDVAPALRAADFYLSTSFSEGMSNSLLEAMSYGVVPIVSRVSGVEDMVTEGGSGFLFEAGDIEGFKAALTRALALDDPGYAGMSRAARAVLAARFSMESVADQHVDLYARIAGERR